MNKNSKIYIAGHRGLVGSSIKRYLEKEGYTNLIYQTSSQLNLMDYEKTEKYFKKNKPEYVFLAAAKVGGIYANSMQPAEFIYDNLSIQNNVIHLSYKYGVKKLLFLGSSCIYPRLSKQPIKEKYLLKGPLGKSNEPYAIAKIAGIKMCQSYNRQYGTNFIACMPNNLYGINDNFDLNSSHVLPALIRKMHDAKVNKKKEVVIWGTGKPKRDFVFVDDLARACVFMMNKYNPTKHENQKGEMYLNIGSASDISIKKLAKMIQKCVGYKGKLVYDISKPDGTPRKLLDTTKINKLGWKPQVTLEDGLKITYNWFLNNYKEK